MSYVVGVNRTGKDASNYEYSGNSLIIDFLGEELSSLNNYETGIVTSVITLDKQNIVRGKLGFLNDKDSFTIN